MLFLSKAEGWLLVKLYLTGPVGAGKSTLARRLAQELSLPCFSMDDVVYEYNPVNRKRSPSERDAIFHDILRRENWVMEDTGRKCFVAAWDEADRILLLEPPALLRRYRIVRRWIRQNMGWEPCGYTPSFAMLRRMFFWSKNYETGDDGFKNRLLAYGGKVIVCRHEKDIVALLSAFAPQSPILPQ